MTKIEVYNLGTNILNLQILVSDQQRNAFFLHEITNLEFEKKY